jgi:hypothetical protein
MNLDRQRLIGEQQLEQQGRDGRVVVRALKPKLSDPIAGYVDAAPGMEIHNPPRLARDLRGGMFDGHRLS